MKLALQATVITHKVDLQYGSPHYSISFTSVDQRGRQVFTENLPINLEASELVLKNNRVRITIEIEKSPTGVDSTWVNAHKENEKGKL